MCYFFQWQYWRTDDPELDAIRGCHDRQAKPLYDMLSTFAMLRRKLREQMGDAALELDTWWEIAEKGVFDNLPKIKQRCHKHLLKPKLPEMFGKRPEQDKPYCTLLHPIITYCTLLYLTVLYCTLLHLLYFTLLPLTSLAAPYCALLHLTSPYCNLLHLTVAYCT